MHAAKTVRCVHGGKLESASGQPNCHQAINTHSRLKSAHAGDFVR